MELYALVGTSGTGKSYKAMGLAREHDIEYLIDDGILISGQRKVAGSSAKREHTKVAAVKRAIFFWEEHREDMISVLENIGPDKLLIIGTSEKMVRQIAKNLRLGPIDHFVYIEDISSEEEIETARFHRMHYGKHVIPLPTVEVKKDFAGYFLDSLKIFTRIFGRKDEVIEKSVVRPTFSFIGNFTISNKTIIQIASRTMHMNPGVGKIAKIKMTKKSVSLALELDIIVKYGYNVHTVGYEVTSEVKRYIELMTQLNVEDVLVTVKAVM